MSMSENNAPLTMSIDQRQYGRNICIAAIFSLCISPLPIVFWGKPLLVSVSIFLVLAMISMVIGCHGLYLYLRGETIDIELQEDGITIFYSSLPRTIIPRKCIDSIECTQVDHVDDSPDVTWCVVLKDEVRPVALSDIQGINTRKLVTMIRNQYPEVQVKTIYISNGLIRRKWEYTSKGKPERKRGRV